MFAISAIPIFSIRFPAQLLSFDWRIIRVSEAGHLTMVTVRYVIAQRVLFAMRNRLDILLASFGEMCRIKGGSIDAAFMRCPEKLFIYLFLF